MSPPRNRRGLPLTPSGGGDGFREGACEYPGRKVEWPDVGSRKVFLRILPAVEIPVMAKVRIGHFVEAQIREALGVDYIDESEVLTWRMRRTI